MMATTGARASPTEIIANLAFRRDVKRVHGLGARAVAELLAETKDPAIHRPGGYVQVFGRDRRYWRLTDYLVSSAVSGPSLIMVRREKTMADLS